MNPRKLIFFAISVLVVGLIVYLAQGQVFKKGTSREDISGEIPDSSSEQVRSFSLCGFSEFGEKAWQIEGKTADILSDIINLSEVNADSYGKEVKVNLKADEGVFCKETNDILLKKNVIIVTDEGTTLTTESLKWHAKDERVSTKDYVYIDRQDMDIEGTGALAKPNLKKAQINKDVKVNIKDPLSVITCDGPLKVDYGKNIAHFFDNVKMVDKDTTIIADKAIAYFEPNERSLNEVFCKGNVEIARGENVTYAEELTYLPKESRVVLTGRPKIIIRETEELLDKKDETAKDRKSN